MTAHSAVKQTANAHGATKDRGLSSDNLTTLITGVNIEKETKLLHCEKR